MEDLYAVYIFLRPEFCPWGIDTATAQRRSYQGKKYWKSKHEQIRDVLFPLPPFPFAKDWKITDIAAVVAEATEEKKGSEEKQMILVLCFVLYTHPNLLELQLYRDSDNDRVVFFLD